MDKERRLYKYSRGNHTRGGYISANIPGPTYPSDATIDKRFPTTADGSVVVATLDGGGMRLMSVTNKAARNYSVFWTAYGSKK